MPTSAASSSANPFVSPSTNVSAIPTASQTAWITPIIWPNSASPLAPELPLAPKLLTAPVVSDAHQEISNSDVLSDVPATALEPIPTSVPEFIEPIERPTPAKPIPSRSDRFMRGETSDVWGLRIDRVRMADTIAAIDNMIADRIPRYVITANLNYAMLADGDAALQKITDEASLVLADGQPLVWRSRCGAAGPLPERVAGSELIYRLAEIAAVRGWRIYFLGAEPGVATQCASTLAKLYPGLQVAGVQSPPYRKLTEAEVQQQHQAIMNSNADILLVAFGQPKGERWIHENYKKLGVPVSMQIGASFDFVAGTSKRAPVIWQKIGMEWAYRMFSDPARLVPRYATNAWFLLISLLRDWNEFVNSKFDKSTPSTNQTQKT